MNNIYSKSKEQIAEEFNYIKSGLTDEEVLKNREKYGINKLQEEKRKSAVAIFFSQFADFLVIILICAAILSVFTDNVHSAIVIIAVIIMNAIIGTVQNLKAEKSLDSLKKLSSPEAKVLRNGSVIQIPSEQVVQGDILVLEAGDLIPADGRITECHRLKINESILTGESLNAEKNDSPLESSNPALADMTNAVFSGTTATYGRAHVLVTDVGENTQLGKIAQLLKSTADHATPLQKSLDDFGKKLSIGIIVLCALIFGLNILKGEPLTDSLMFAVALAVAAIPEALSSIVTISLAIGTAKMVKENAIVKNLTAVEGLGCVNIVCSDKTGTLTQNVMTVVETFSFGKESEDELFLSAILCNDGKVTKENTIGDPTETALIDYYLKIKTDYDKQLKEHIRVGELPFDSDRKLMSTINKEENGTLTMYTKGAVDVLLERVVSIYENGAPRPVTSEDIELIKNTNLKMSENGLRVMAFAKKDVQSATVDFSDEKDFIFLGLMAMIDPLREETSDAVANCKKAGIKTIMITGDHKITAKTIAKQCGIFSDDDLVYTGKEIDGLTDEELSDKLEKITVYARVSPENKIRIVDLWQKKNKIVAMTGDGVNDAPALKKADVGIAMGITGTQVSKDAASMILTDDNFATIIKSVVNGRNIYNNIKNAVGFLISGNAAGIITVLYASLFGLPVPFAAVHLLFINLLTDSLPALAISAEKAAKDLIKEKPRDTSQSILSKDTLISISLQGIAIAIFTIIAFHQGLKVDALTASTMAFSTMCLARLWHGFTCRSTHFIGSIGVFKNKATVGAFIAGVILLAAVLFISPLAKAFEISPLNITNIITIIICSFMPTLIIQIKRFMFNK